MACCWCKVTAPHPTADLAGGTPIAQKLREAGYDVQLAARQLGAIANVSRGVLQPIPATCMQQLARPVAGSHAHVLTPILDPSGAGTLPAEAASRRVG
jgi:hypothetical protein